MAPSSSSPSSARASVGESGSGPLVPLAQAALHWATQRWVKPGGTLLAEGLRESERQRQQRLERELEEARRLGRWFTEEDRQLVREHEARLVSQRWQAGWLQVRRTGTVGLIGLACVMPLLWPLALLASWTTFPLTSRRLAFGLLALSGGTLLAAGVAVVQLGRQLAAPASPAIARLTPVEDATRGSELAARLLQACDYWIPQARSEDGGITYRKGLYQSWNGRPVMVLPRSTWALLSAGDRQALTAHLRRSGDAEAIHLGRLQPGNGEGGSTIAVAEAVWSAAERR
ncbi:MAG: hypothetical protein ACKO8I_05105 [Cyanobacteriota bacterium]